MLTFYMTPGSCTTGIHILLEECEALFAVELVNLIAGDQRAEPFLAMNPKGSIPMLRLGSGEVLTEFEAIACWLAWSHPKAKLMPSEPLAAARVVEMMAYAVGTVHMQAFARIFTPEKFALHDEKLDAVKEQGVQQALSSFGVIDKLLPVEGFVCGNFSVADAALFYVEFWADRSGIELPPRVRAHYEAVLKRPKVRQVLQEEGYRI